MIENKGFMYGKKILIIDDDFSLCQSIKMNFTKVGSIVYTATDGLMGLQRFQEHQPDLVILDIQMPIMDGWETCQTIRKASQTPIIMLTGLYQDHEISQALECGANDFVAKPFSREVLNARVERQLRRFCLVPPLILEHKTAYWGMVAP